MLLAGCATSPQDCDLHTQDPSFITKLNCAASGGYRQKIDAQEQQVRQGQRDNKLATQDLVNTQNRELASSQQLANEKTKLTALRTDLNKTLKRLQSSAVKNTQSKQEIKQLQALQRQSQHAKGDSEIADIERKIAEAKQRIEALEQANTLR